MVREGHHGLPMAPVRRNWGEPVPSALRSSARHTSGHPKQSLSEEDMSADAPVRRPSRAALLSLVAVAISGLALILSSVALVVASRDDEVSTAPAAAPGPPPPELSDQESPTPTVDDTHDASTEGPSPSDEETFSLPPVGDYQLVYERKQITLNPTESCDSRSVDLDQPLVMGAYEEGGDVTYSACSDAPTPKLTFADHRIAIVRPGKVSPEDCAQRIGSAPTDTEVIPSQELTICAVTDGVGDPNQPQRAKIAVMVIDAVAINGTVNATLSAWEIPR
jgi:hypothetical protein